MANKRRGEVAAPLAGRTRTLCLTLGALAELEDAFGLDDLGALARRFGSGRLSARDLVRLVGAGLRGAGETITDPEIAAWPAAAAGEMADAAAALLGATFGAPAPGTSPDPQDPPDPQGT